MTREEWEQTNFPIQLTREMCGDYTATIPSLGAATFVCCEDALIQAIIGLESLKNYLYDTVVEYNLNQRDDNKRIKIPEHKIGYKIFTIVEENNNIIESYDYDARHSRLYTMNKWNKREDNNGPIVMFKKLEDAVNAYNNIKNKNRRSSILMEVLYKESKESKVWYNSSTNNRSEMTLQLLEGYYPGAILAEEINPIRNILENVERIT